MNRPVSSEPRSPPARRCAARQAHARSRFGRATRPQPRTDRTPAEGPPPSPGSRARTAVRGSVRPFSSSPSPSFLPWGFGCSGPSRVPCLPLRTSSVPALVSVPASSAARPSARVPEPPLYDADPRPLSRRPPSAPPSPNSTDSRHRTTPPSPATLKPAAASGPRRSRSDSPSPPPVGSRRPPAVPQGWTRLMGRGTGRDGPPTAYRATVPPAYQRSGPWPGCSPNTIARSLRLRVWPPWPGE